jgi:hypothetical protein
MGLDGCTRKRRKEKKEMVFILIQVVSVGREKLFFRLQEQTRA